MSSEPIEVTAEVIETTELAVTYTPAVIDDNLAALEAYVDGQIAPYMGMAIDPNSEYELKNARAVMATLNKLKKPIDDERKRVKREYDAPLKEFEAMVKAITSKIDEARDFVKVQVENADEAFKERRKAHLAEEYEGVAGLLAGVIPFDAICEPEWLRRSKAESAAEAALQDKAQTALKGYETLMKKQLVHADEVMKRYAETLDVIAALELEDELNEKDRRMAEFKAAQAKVEAVRNPEPEPEPQPEPEPEPAPQPEPETTDAGPVLRWSLSMEFTGTRGYARVIADTLNRLGITGSTIKALEVVENG